MYTDILNFWFEEIDPANWWVKDTAFDQLLIERFTHIHNAANACELFEWRQSAQGRLAEIIVLDQFSRNMFRDTPRAFASDSLALALAQEAVALGVDQSLNNAERSFLYMPYMHSESLKIHDIAVELFKANGVESSYTFELKHQVIIQKYGRYPHRNKILGRVSTAEELAFLRKPGSSF